MRLLAYVAAAAVAVAGCGCGKEAPPETGGGAEAPSRLNDPEYRKALKGKRVERQEIMVELSKAKEALDKAVASDPELKTESAKAAKAKYDELAKAYLDNQKASQVIVAARIKADLDKAASEQGASTQTTSKQKKGD